MAKKKRKPEDESPKPPRRPKPKAKPKSGPRSEVAPPPRAAIDALMKQLLGRDRRPGPRRAEALLHQAFQSDDPAEVVALARQALEVWPDCADAYVLLAEQARGPQEALELYALGVEAAERDLGEAAFREAVGHFWGVLPTRPYMRARHGLAQSLWVLGRRAEAVEHYQEMLRLNPTDNQGVRYNLAACLIEIGRDEDLAALLEQLPGRPLGELGLQRRAAGLPPRGGLARRPQAADGGQEGEQVRPRLPDRPRDAPVADARLGRPGRPRRGGRLRGRVPQRLAGDPRRARLAPQVVRRGPAPTESKAKAAKGPTPTAKKRLEAAPAAVRRRLAGRGPPPARSG